MVVIRITSFLSEDSGFAVPDLHESCEKNRFLFVIRLKPNANLQHLSDELHSVSSSRDMSAPSVILKKAAIKQNHEKKHEKSLFNPF
ncbi:hypothetical protein ACFQ4Z_03965 [Oceanobacillus oncorhynchi subsp. oncorhynchi]|uniref:hypothetical protein n=1 Tax=Oceanobacillus oncorhynchi TaxID=545501 RepID=UPI00362DC503